MTKTNTPGGAQNGARRLLIEALARENGPLTTNEMQERIPRFTAKQINDNLSAGRREGFFKTDKDDVTGRPLHHLTAQGKAWWKTNGTGPAKEASPAKPETEAAEEETKQPAAETNGWTIGTMMNELITSVRSSNPIDTTITLDDLANAMQDIGNIAKDYMQEGELILQGVRTMDLLIDAHEAALEAQAELIVAYERENTWLQAELEMARRREQFAPAADPQTTSTTYIIAAGWQTVNGLEAANEAAIHLAMGSAGGRAVIARPAHMASVTVELQEFKP